MSNVSRNYPRSTGARWFRERAEKRGIIGQYRPRLSIIGRSYRARWSDKSAAAAGLPKREFPACCRRHKCGGRAAWVTKLVPGVRTMSAICLPHIAKAAALVQESCGKRYRKRIPAWQLLPGKGTIWRRLKAVDWIETTTSIYIQKKIKICGVEKHDV